MYVAKGEGINSEIDLMTHLDLVNDTLVCVRVTKCGCLGFGTNDPSLSPAPPVINVVSSKLSSPKQQDLMNCYICMEQYSRKLQHQTNNYMQAALNG